VVLVSLNTFFLKVRKTASGRKSIIKSSERIFKYRVQISIAFFWKECSAERDEPQFRGKGQEV